jgi:hypothetical protein
MKKFLLILAITLISLFKVNGQTYQTEMYIGWQLVGTPSWTSPSFYYCVTRSQYPIQGRYYFDVYFTSNAYTWDRYNNRKTWRYVYMDNLKMTWDGYYGNYGKSISFSFIENYAPQQLRWTTSNKTPLVKLYWNSYKTL